MYSRRVERRVCWSGGGVGGDGVWRTASVPFVSVSGVVVGVDSVGGIVELKGVCVGNSLNSPTSPDSGEIVELVLCVSMGVSGREGIVMVSYW